MILFALQLRANVYYVLEPERIKIKFDWDEFVFSGCVTAGTSVTTYPLLKQNKVKRAKTNTIHDIYPHCYLCF